MDDGRNAVEAARSSSEVEATSQEYGQSGMTGSSQGKGVRGRVGALWKGGNIEKGCGHRNSVRGGGGGKGINAVEGTRLTASPLIL